VKTLSGPRDHTWDGALTGGPGLLVGLLLVPFLALGLALLPSPLGVAIAALAAAGIFGGLRGFSSIALTAVVAGTCLLYLTDAGESLQALVPNGKSLWGLLALAVCSLFLRLGQLGVAALFLVLGEIAVAWLVEGGSLTAVARQTLPLFTWGAALFGLAALRRWDRRRLSIALAELAQSRETYLSVVERQTELVCRYRPTDGTLTFVNPAYARYFGTTPERLVGTSFFLLAPEGERERIRRYVASIGPDSTPPSVDHKTVAGDGSISWMRWVDRPVRVDGGRVVEIQAVGHDVSALRDALDALTAGNERLARREVMISALSLLAHRLDRLAFAARVAVTAAREFPATHVEVYDFAPDGNQVKLIAESAIRGVLPRQMPVDRHPFLATRFSSQDDLAPIHELDEGGAPFDRHLVDIDGPQGRGLVAPVFADGRRQGALVLSQPSGGGGWSSDDRTFAVALAAILAIAFERDRRLSLHDDLEARVRDRTVDLASAHEALRRAETLSAVGALVAGVAHEVRNPLFAMSASLDAFDEQFRDDARFVEYSNHFRHEMTRLEELMRQLLDYARPEAVSLTERSLYEVAHLAVSSCRPLADKLGVRLDLDGDRTATARISPGRLQQAIQNLVENALQHSPPGATVTVSLGAEDGGDDWCLTIQDRGPGFAEHDLEFLFEPFFTRRQGGTGLGLSIAQRNIEMQRGRVELDNRPDGGAEARIYLSRTTADMVF
jgi:PAS domain S-box-containing protein